MSNTIDISKGSVSEISQIGEKEVESDGKGWPCVGGKEEKKTKS